MATNVCRKRLQKEFVAIKKNPVEHIKAAPNEKNLLEWHYVVEGPKGSVYEGGVYHGILRFPKEYPYKPPAILMLTRNGRFKTNSRLCLSMSDFHPEQWNPMWSVSSILSGLLSFMLDAEPTLGSIETTAAQRRAFAARSLEENVRDKNFCTLFPEYVEQYNKRRKERASASETASASQNATSTESLTKGKPVGAGSGGAKHGPEPGATSIFSWSAIVAACAALAVALLVYYPAAASRSG